MSKSQFSSHETPFTIGIDLGTTNCAVAYTENITGRESNIKPFQVMQFISKGKILPLSFLPSYLYIPEPHEFIRANIRLPWNVEVNYVIGELGKKLGTNAPAHLVSSAKSWLSYAGVDRKSAILPWRKGNDVEKLSPVEASSRYLQHIRDAWNYTMAKGKPEHWLQFQNVILTVPASFDEISRQLTLAAAQRAGLEKVTLLEEPQAAFYAWIASKRGAWHRYLGKSQIILICDVGGGTTDFSLITIQEEEPLFTRVAVGDHLILGGDNIDMALARHIQTKLMGEPVKLDFSQWTMLCQGCQTAKEELLSESHDYTSWPVIVQDRSGRFIGNNLKYELTKDEINKIILNEFFPITRFDEEPTKADQMVRFESGLPYPQDTAISRHLASFLRKHQTTMLLHGREKAKWPASDLTKPDAILFNGGGVKPTFLQERLIRIMSNWFSSRPDFQEETKGDWRPTVLSHNLGNLAVAYGAVCYGLVRQGKGICIHGGIGRSYYIGIGRERHEVEKSSECDPKAFCLVPGKMEEGQHVEIIDIDKEFTLLPGEPVSFPLYISSTRLWDQPGDIVPIDDDTLIPLPPIQILLRQEQIKLKEIPMHLMARLTEVGTLELWCVSREQDRQCKIPFGIKAEEKIRPSREEKGEKPASSVTGSQESLDKAKNRADGKFCPPPLSGLNANSKAIPQTNRDTAPENLCIKTEKSPNSDHYYRPIFILRKILEFIHHKLTPT